MALIATRPTRAMSFMRATPCTTVQKITGPISMRIRAMKASPSGFIAAPMFGAKWPSRIPATIPISQNACAG